MQAHQPTLNDFIKQLPLKQRLPIVALRKIVSQRQTIDAQQQQSIQRIKLTYQDRLKPLLQRASEIIRGGQLREEEVTEAQLYLNAGESLKNHMKGKLIDKYWVSVLLNSPLVDQVTENDQKALQYLIDIQNVYPQADKSSENISLKFVFKENPYFNQTVLIRTLIISSGQMLALEGTPLTWKQGKFLTHQKKKITNKKTGQSKIDKGKKIPSFFDLFLDYTSQNQSELSKAGSFMVELGNMIVMDSLDYFLGLINEDEQGSEGDEEEEDEEDMEEEEGNKRLKQ